MSEGSRPRLPIGLEPTEMSDRDRSLGLDATEISERELPLDGGRASQPRLGVEGTLLGVGPASNPTSPEGGPVVGELLPGEHVGRYVIERKVGAGGMGEVYAAHDPQLDRRVAIKVLRPTGRSGDAAARLLREAQALAKLAHPNVVAVHDVGAADGRVFLAMQFVEGSTLGDHLARNRLSPDEIVKLYVAAGRGLAAAHAAGLIHRDMKPSNVLIDRDGQVAVTDFGVARAADDAATTDPGASGASWTTPGSSGTGKSALSTDMTQAGAVIGTPSYMAPEQHAGKRATAKSDQFGFCVSLWQGLFHKHPFVPHDHDETTTAFEYMALISEGVLIAPRGNRTPGGEPVPRRVLAALTRGLAKDPAARWPSMTALLAELEPPSRTRAVVIGLAAVATAGAAAALWFGLHGRGAAGPSCTASAGERAATAWNRERAAAIAAGFGKSGRPYAAATSQASAAALDQYSQRWRALAADACAGNLGANGDGGTTLAAARSQCLDRSLAALRSTVTLLAETKRPELVDNALAVVSGLPDLDDCADPAALLAIGAPPPERAAQIAALEERLVTARARFASGLLRETIDELQALLPEIDATGWPSLQVRARTLLGEQRVAAFDTTGDQVIEAARIATEHGLARDAARAWNLLIPIAGIQRRPDAVAAYTEIARATALATHEARLINGVRIAHARALIRMRDLPPAEVECRAAIADLQARPDADYREQTAARDCLLEALLPLGKAEEARQLAELAVAEASARLSPEHPSVADYLTVISHAKRSTGHFDEARADLERARQIRERAFGKRHWKYIDSTKDLAFFERDPVKRKAALEEALAATRDPAVANPRLPYVEYAIENGLAELSAQAGDQDGMQRHFDRAIALAGKLAGARSLDVAMLMIGYGQYLVRVDLDRSIATLEQATEILDGLNDHRAEVGRSALALIYMQHDRYREALPLLERALAAVDEQDIEPFNLAMMRFSLARALAETRGDRARARTLAVQARDGFLASEHPDNAKPVVAWLKKHR